MFEGEVLVRGAWINGDYRGQPIAPGMPSNLAENILVLEYGAPESLAIIKQHARTKSPRCMVEPVQFLCIPELQPWNSCTSCAPSPTRTDVVLIFDEVVTGFRRHLGGAPVYFGIKADMATYGKVIGGGMPIGVLAGSKKYLDALDGGQWNYGDDSFPKSASPSLRAPLSGIRSPWRQRSPSLKHLKEPRSLSSAKTERASQPAPAACSTNILRKSRYQFAFPISARSR